jgi:hypothetical protein
VCTRLTDDVLTELGTRTSWEIPHGLHMGFNVGIPGISPAVPSGHGKGAASFQPVSTSSPSLTAESAAATAVAAAGGMLPHGMSYSAYSPGVHPVHRVPMGMPILGTPNMPIMHALPWGSPWMPYSMAKPWSVGAALENAALSTNPTLCKPIASLATPNNWPLRFPFPGVPEHTAVSTVAMTVATQVVSEVVAELPAVEPKAADSPVVAPSSSVPSAPMAASTACPPSKNPQRFTSSSLYNLTESPRALVSGQPDGVRSARSSDGSMGSIRSLEEVLDKGMRALRRSLDEGTREVAVSCHSSLLSQQDGRRSRGPSIDEGHRPIPIPPG